MKKPVICLCMTALLLGFTACQTTENSESSQENSVAERNEGVASNQKDTELFSGDKETEQKDINSIRQTLVEVLGEDYWPDMQIAPEYLEEYGLYSDIYDEFYGEMPKDTINVDTLIIIGAKEGMVEEAEEVLNRYREALVEDTAQYPVNVGKIQASRIETIGNYVCFVQLGADITKEYGKNGNEDAVIRHCQEQNELAIEAISKKLGG